jgi:uncharacterized cupredoxin-like copper-binding protein
LVALPKLNQRKDFTRMTKFRIGLFALVAVIAASLVALPATAQQSKATATVNVTAGKPSEFKFTVSAKSVKAGAVTFVVKNAGALPHDFKIGGKKTPVLQSGQSAKLTVNLKKGNAAYLCAVSGHAAAGMKGVLKVS